MSAHRSKSRKRLLQYPYALQSFLGHLEGTGKSAHTISNYKLDLNSFHRFLEKHQKKVQLENVFHKDLQSYSSFLITEGFKVNTQRRKLLTLKKFFKYLASRKLINIELGTQMATPFKVERVPESIDSKILLNHILEVPLTPILSLRNRLLLRTLFETGCSVSEISTLSFYSFLQLDKANSHVLSFEGKNQRRVPISAQFFSEIQELKRQSKNKDYPFLGFNKFGPLQGRISPRAIELLVKHFGAKWGIKKITPRIIRHSVVVAWYKQGLSKDEIQKRLGLKTAYSFKIYEPIFAKLDPTRKPH